MTGNAAARRYALLSFLLWLPAGLYLVPLVLLMLDRGLPVATIAVVGVVYGLTIAVLELPTGGLADVLGRRPVLIASAVAGAAGLLLLGLAETVALFLASAVLRGAARALSTGPLEAWYVDTVHAELGRDADLTAGLARGEVAASLALSAGTLVGGLLPLALGGVAGLPALAVPVLLAAGAEALRGLLTVRLPEPPHPRPALAAVLRGVPATVAAGLRVAGRDRALTRVLLAAGGAGIALGTIELLTPAWLAGLSSGPRAAATYAVVAAAGFGADAIGGMLAVAAVRHFGSHARAAMAGWGVSALALAGLAGCALLSGTAAMVFAGVAYCVLFIGLGAGFPAQAHLLHERVEPGERATVLSVQSLLMQAVGAVVIPVIGWQATRNGIEVGYAIAAVALLASAGLFLRLRAAPRIAAEAPARAFGALT
ncbi:MFS transporter [Actinoplanes sp. ATCC 53533]|uniref:MFS transporter n=1 Tax=Actinoplanes sp. ATCC 53533 TaxID=1288362 RepID=UPI000F7ADF77|nr:MFS transporter [Actinoplanes sp. ATCC 53533]RSM53714.1 MFS transporter [Actinoplanes sp. ATCC 53533]